MKHWSKVQIATSVYIIKFVQNIEESSFTLWLSDFKTLWNETINSKDGLHQRFSDLNPALEIDDQVIDQLIEKLEKYDTMTIITDIKPNSGEVMLEMNIEDEQENPLKFNWVLTKCDENTFFEEITKPMLHQISELQHSKQQLINVAKKKDEQIGQYILVRDPDQIRKKFITKKFDDAEFAPQSQMFSCEIDEFQDIIGVLSKNIEKPKPEPVPNSPKKPISSPRKNRIRRLREIVKPGEVIYGDDDDHDHDLVLKATPSNPVKTEPVQTPTEQSKPSARKRIRRDFNI